MLLSWRCITFGDAPLNPPWCLHRSEGEEDEPLFGAKKPPRAKAADAELVAAGAEGAAADGVVATVTLQPGEPRRRRWFQRSPADDVLSVRATAVLSCECYLLELGSCCGSAVAACARCVGALWPFGIAAGEADAAGLGPIAAPLRCICCCMSAGHQALPPETHVIV